MNSAQINAKPATAGELLLTGLDGSNPLGFLAALGTLAVLDRIPAKVPVRMRWRQLAGAWRPAIQTAHSLDQIIDLLATEIGLGETRPEARHPFLLLGKNLSVDPVGFRAAAASAVDEASCRARRTPDMMASFGCDLITHEKLPRIIPTEMHFIFGSGHQHFLDTAGKLWRSTTREHLREALAGPWLYRDERLSFRWEPLDAREHAYQWTAPGDETTTTVWGANVLAFEAMPFLTTLPQGARLATVGFERANRQTTFSWPIWSTWITAAVVRTILSLSRSYSEGAAREQHQAQGIESVYQVSKIKLGDGANFKWAFTPSQRIS